MSDDQWWSEFVEHAVAKGQDRAKAEAAVDEFRAAQRSLSDEIAKLSDPARDTANHHRSMDFDAEQ